VPDLKELARRMPVLGPLLVRMKRRYAKDPAFNHSTQYWEDRYASGGNSGAGSYSRLAEFKAEFLNAFVAENAVTEVGELGCGDGAQLTLARYPKYVGYDISATTIERCRARFSADSTKRFVVLGRDVEVAQADMMMSLDVVYHLIEDEVFEQYMERLFRAARRFVVIYSSNYDQYETDHVRHRQFDSWVKQNCPDFDLLQRTPNRYPFDPMSPTKTSVSDFFVYKRLLAD